MAPKDKILKDKPDNRFSPIVKAAHSPARSPKTNSPLADKLARSQSALKRDAENLVNGSPSKGSPAKLGLTRASAPSIPRKALNLLGSTPPKHPAKPSDIHIQNQTTKAEALEEDVQEFNSEMDWAVNPQSSSVHLRLRSNTF